MIEKEQISVPADKPGVGDMLSTKFVYSLRDSSLVSYSL